MVQRQNFGGLGGKRGPFKFKGAVNLIDLNVNGVNGKQPETRIGRRETRDVTKISSCWVNATSRQGI